MNYEKAQHQVKAAARTLVDNTRISEPLALNALLGIVFINSLTLLSQNQFDENALYTSHMSKNIHESE